MNADAKKIALRMIPYGIYVLTVDDGKGGVAAATVNWVTQTAFAPPLVVVGVKTDSGAYALLKNTKSFVLNMLGKDQKGLAFTFFKPAAARRRQDQRPRLHESGQWLADPRRRDRRGRMQGHHDRRAGRSSHRCRRGDRGASAETRSRAGRMPPSSR